MPAPLNDTSTDCGADSWLSTALVLNPRKVSCVADSVIRGALLTLMVRVSVRAA